MQLFVPLLLFYCYFDWKIRKTNDQPNSFHYFAHYFKTFSLFAFPIRFPHWMCQNKLPHTNLFPEFLFPLIPYSVVVSKVRFWTYSFQYDPLSHNFFSQLSIWILFLFANFNPLISPVLPTSHWRNNTNTFCIVDCWHLLAEHIQNTIDRMCVPSLLVHCTTQ